MLVAVAEGDAYVLDPKTEVVLREGKAADVMVIPHAGNKTIVRLKSGSWREVSLERSGTATERQLLGALSDATGPLTACCIRAPERRRSGRVVANQQRITRRDFFDGTLLAAGTAAAARLWPAPATPRG